MCNNNESATINYVSGNSKVVTDMSIVCYGGGEIEGLGGDDEAYRVSTDGKNRCFLSDEEK